MILALSTSSPRIAVALLRNDFSVAIQHVEFAERNASEVAIRLTERAFAEQGVNWSQLIAFAVDVGPGSFTGVKIGITMVKMWAGLDSNPVYVVSAFDLISCVAGVAIPYKRTAHLFREPGSPPVPAEGEIDVSVRGYGRDGNNDYPDWSGVGSLLNRCQPVQAKSVVPNYVVEPSISLPKVPFVQ